MDFEDTIALLMEDFLSTLGDESDYWDGVYCSDRAMATRFLKEFLDFIRNPLKSETPKNDQATMG